MTYNLTGLYDRGFIDYVHVLNTNTNFVFLDVLLVTIFIVIFGIFAGQQKETKNTLLWTSFLVFIFSSVVTFSIAATGHYAQSDIDYYTTRTFITFAVTVLALLYHVLSD